MTQSWQSWSSSHDNHYFHHLAICSQRDWGWTWWPEHVSTTNTHTLIMIWNDDLETKFLCFFLFISNITFDWTSIIGLLKLLSVVKLVGLVKLVSLLKLVNMMKLVRPAKLANPEKLVNLVNLMKLVNLLNLVKLEWAQWNLWKHRN